MHTHLTLLCTMRRSHIFTETISIVLNESRLANSRHCFCCYFQFIAHTSFSCKCARDVSCCIVIMQSLYVFFSINFVGLLLYQTSALFASIFIYFYWHGRAWNGAQTVVIIKQFDWYTKHNSTRNVSWLYSKEEKNKNNLKWIVVISILVPHIL